ncbi:hypothetical protein U1Q18_010793 [Sarracenia purpurea var. burkii]
MKKLSACQRVIRTLQGLDVTMTSWTRTQHAHMLINRSGQTGGKSVMLRCPRSTNWGLERDRKLIRSWADLRMQICSFAK